MKSACTLPAEWERQSAILVAWPDRSMDWASRLADVQAALLDWLALLLEDQPVLLLHQPDSTCDWQAFNQHPNFHTLAIPLNDTWVRDTAPMGVNNTQQTPELVAFTFNGWGNLYACQHDVQVANQTSEYLNSTLKQSPVNLEGGGIETDGAGTILTTRSVLNHRHRNMSDAEWLLALQSLFQVRQLHILEHGMLQGDDTNGHIDTIVRFVDRDSLVFQACDEPDDSHYSELNAMRNELQALRTEQGQPYRLHPLPMPAAQYDGNNRLPASYANFVITNRSIYVPQFGCDQDALACEIFVGLFPDRRVVGIHSNPFIWQGGGLHCLSMQLPKGFSLP